MLRPPAGASQDCRSFVYAVYDTLYNNTTPLVKLPTASNCRGRQRRREDCGCGCVEVNPLGFQSGYRVSFPGKAGRLTAEQIAEVLFSGARIYHVDLIAEVVPLCEGGAT